ncbi:MAG TPA: DUF3344 domain-containing protein [Gemmatimonadaceae bacterium]|nr:DUF3344 domain-containing protein [Gemmatimonadaceae bacterium]
MRRLGRLGGAAIALAFGVAAPADAQFASRGSWEGTIGYAVTGASLRDDDNVGTGSACEVVASRSATLAGIPAGATILRAYLYWAGSGPVDATVRFDGSNRSADQTWTASYNNGGNNLTWFGGRDDVTDRVTGNDTFTFSNLTVTVTGSHCSSQAVVAGWSLVVVYSHASQPVRRIDLRDGFDALRDETMSIVLGNFLSAETPGARFTFLAWEGDSDITGGEFVRFNGATISTPAGNNFNNTINGAGSQWGVDLDSFDGSASLPAGSRGATIEVGVAGDLILPQAAISAIDIALVSVTPDGLPAPVARLGGGSTPYAQTFQVENASDSTRQYDLRSLVVGAPAPFITIDSVTGPGMVGSRTRPDSIRVSMTRLATQSFQVWYRVAAGAPADNVLFLHGRSVAFPAAAAGSDEGFQQIRRGAPSLALARSVTPNANIAPGMDLTYAISVTNPGSYEATAIVVRDVVPSPLDFRVGSPSQTLPAGMTSIVEYSIDAGATWTYAPVSAGCGAPASYDRCVRAIRWRLTGTLAPNGAQNATLSFVARVP